MQYITQYITKKCSHLVERCTHYCRSARKKIGTWAAAYIFERIIIRGILATCRIEVQGIDTLHKVAKQHPTMALTWHNRLIIFSYAIDKYASKLPFAALISKSSDGEILSTIARRHNNITQIRAAHDARHNALRSIVQAITQDKRILIVTPDGPRGPRYRCKPGAVVAARKSYAHIFGVTWYASKYWQLKSWDRMLIPKPFSRLIFGISAPMTLTTGVTLKANREQVDAFLINWDKTVCSQITVDKSRWPK